MAMNTSLRHLLKRNRPGLVPKDAISWNKKQPEQPPPPQEDSCGGSSSSSCDAGGSRSSQDRRLSSYKNMASILYRQEKWDESMTLYEKCVTIQIETLGEQHRDVAMTYHQMANIQLDQGKLQEALELFQQCLDIEIQTLGDCEEVATTYNIIANIVWQQDKPTQALVLYKKALEIWKQTLGEHDIHVAEVYNVMAFVLREQGKFPQALDHYKQALHIWNIALGGGEHQQEQQQEHPVVAMTYFNLALTLWEQQDLEQLDVAIPLLETAVEMYTKLLASAAAADRADADHVDDDEMIEMYYVQLDQCYKYMALIYHKARQEPIHALECWETCLQIRTNHLQQQHEDHSANAATSSSGTVEVLVAEVYCQMAQLLALMGDLDQANLLFQKAMEIWKRGAMDANIQEDMMTECLTVLQQCQQQQQQQQSHPNR